ncbi:MAG: hypothetical protein LBC78_04545, partial [Oscillospiraceae bacterium]|nr:hypothetical protein [Oscillospiraceae bacterium]
MEDRPAWNSNNEPEITLESILAEYKGEAFIKNDKRTPSDVLEEASRRIVAEESGAPKEQTLPRAAEPRPAQEAGFAPERAGTERPASLFEEFDLPFDDAFGDMKNAKPRGDTRHTARAPAAPPTKKTGGDDEFDGFGADFGIESASAEDDPDDLDGYASEADEAETDEVSDDDLRFFENYTYADTDPDEELIRSVNRAIEDENRSENKEPGLLTRFLASFFNERPVRQRAETGWQEEDLPEPDYRKQARIYARAVGGVSIRALCASPVCFLMALATLLFEGGRNLPFGLGSNRIAVCAALLIMQLVIMALSYDLLICGFRAFVRGAPGRESLALAGNIAALIAGVFSIAHGGSAAAPYSAASAISLAFLLMGERVHLLAIAATLKTAGAREKGALFSEYRLDIDRTVLKQVQERSDGFYTNLCRADPAETAYLCFAPVILIICVLVSAYAGLVHKADAAAFPRTLALLTVGASVFQSALVFSSPFQTAVVSLNKSGSALAAAGGMDDIVFTDGLCVSDNDIFPAGTLSVGNPQIPEPIPQKAGVVAVRYTASLLLLTGGVLSDTFAELVKRNNIPKSEVADFRRYNEGGVGGRIDGLNVMTGSSALMKLYNVRIPDKMLHRDAVYTAVNGRLFAVFPLEYKPRESTKHSLLSLVRLRVLCYLSVRDFNITPKMMNQKFNIAQDAMEFFPVADTYALGDEARDGAGRVAAILGRPGIESAAQVVYHAHTLRRNCSILMATAMCASVIGTALLSALSVIGTAGVIRAGLLLAFMLLSALVSGAL